MFARLEDQLTVMRPSVLADISGMLVREPRVHTESVQMRKCRSPNRTDYHSIQESQNENYQKANSD
jgi:hypothetical protein